MRRVLFVDDDPSTFDEIAQSLSTGHSAWALAHLESPNTALLECELEPFDIVVTAAVLPEMTAAAFLTAVAERWPGTVRIVMSAETQADQAIDAARVAHQVLMKPCDPALVRDVIDRACGLRDLLTDRFVEEIVGGLETLPAIPAVYQSLTVLLSRDVVATTEVAAIVEQDVSLAAKTLQLANSSFFGPGRRVASVERAVTLLGSRLIQSLALSHGIFAVLDRQVLPLGFDPGEEQAHAISVAGLARRIASPRQAEAAFTAGLLHDIGRLLLAIRAPERYSEVWSHASESGISFLDAERALLGTTHAELGACLLGAWGLPWAIVRAVRYHHNPLVDDETADLALRIHVADALIREHEPNAKVEALFPATLDVDAVAARGLGDSVSDWREWTEARLTAAAP